MVAVERLAAAVERLAAAGRSATRPFSAVEAQTWCSSVLLLLVATVQLGFDEAPWEARLHLPRCQATTLPPELELEQKQMLKPTLEREQQPAPVPMPAPVPAFAGRVEVARPRAMASQRGSAW